MTSTPLRLSDLCPIDCHSAKAAFVVPAPGMPKEEFVFATEDRRHFYAIQPKNHDLRPGAEPGLNPKVAIVGLSAAATQIDGFVETYDSLRDYDKAARHASFKDLVPDIIDMLRATGGARYLSLDFPSRATFDRHPDILCDSLVKCASMTDEGKSTDWDPAAFTVASRCVTRRFVPNMLNPRFTRLKHIVILGTKAWAAINALEVQSGQSVYAELVDQGKQVLQFPHPSRENGLQVKLAKQDPFPAREAWLDAKYVAYLARCRKKKRKPKSESDYREWAGNSWDFVQRVRQQFC